MTVNELIAELTKYPGDMHIVWYDSSMSSGYINMNEPKILMRYVSFDPEKKEYDEECFANQTEKHRPWELMKVMTIE